MKIIETYKKLYIGLYLCFAFSIVLLNFPIELFESYSLIDSKSLKSLVGQLSQQKKDRLKNEGGKTFGLGINNHVKYELSLPQKASSSDPRDPGGATGENELEGYFRMDLLDRNEFQLSTSQGLIDVQVKYRNNGTFDLSFVRMFEKKAAEKYPALHLLNGKFIIFIMALVIAIRLYPLYSYNFTGRCGDISALENRIIGLPIFILALAWSAGLIKLCANLACCYIVTGGVSTGVALLFTVSFLMFAALVSLLTLGFTQEYINRHIAAPFFEKHDPYAIRSGSSINLTMRFIIIIFSIGVAPTVLGLYLPLAFNSGLMSGFSSITDVLDNFEVVVPLLITFFFALFFFTMQLASLFSLRKNFIVPINNLVRRMGRVSKGDFKCKTSVLYVDEIGQLKGHFNSMLDGLVEREKIKDTFGKFISFEIAEKLLKEKKVNLMGEEIEATILFSDIRNFTPLGEKLGASGLVEFLNLYFSHIVKPIHEHNGVINKFIGDAVMAVFSPIFGNAGHEESAVRSALGMRRALETFNALNKYPPVKFGVGIHRGKLVAGNIGTEERMEYTFIGDNVNIASRIESENKTFNSDILISEQVFAALGDEMKSGLKLEKCDRVHVKGREGELTLYKIL